MNRHDKELEIRKLRRELEESRRLLRAQQDALHQALWKEQETAEQLDLLRGQLQAFAVDFRRVRGAERAMSQEVRTAQEDAATRLLSASRFRDQETGAHILRVGLYSRILARHLGIGELDIDVIFRAAQLHDLGKIGVPDAVLHKPGKLDAAEWVAMREHAWIGAQLLEGAKSPVLSAAYQIALSHHENYDGSGYPQELRGEQIPLAGRIVKLADTYDALRTRRPYKPPLDHSTATLVILRGDGRTQPAHFDPLALRAFEASEEEFEAAYESCREEDAAPAEPSRKEAWCEKYS